MNIKLTSSRRILVLALLSSFVLPTLGTYNTSATQQTEAELVAKTEVAKAQNVLDSTRPTKFEAEKIAGELEKFSTFTEPEGSSLQSMERLTRTVDSMFKPSSDRPKLQQQIEDAKGKLGDATKKLNVAKSALGTGPGNESVESAKALVQAKIGDISTMTSELEALDQKLTSNLEAIYDRVIKVAEKADERLNPFISLPAEPAALLSRFQTKLSDVPPMMQFQVDLQESWENLSGKMERVFDGHSDKAKLVQTKLTNLKKSTATVAKNINASLGTLATYAGGQEDKLFGVSEDFRKAPIGQETIAVKNIHDAQIMASSLEEINRLTASISEQAKSAGIEGFDKTAAESAQKILTSSATSLRRQASAFNELVSGDRSLWVTEKIRLYYFTDIPRLIQTLNPDATLTGGDADARRQAQVRLENLRAAEDAQSEANANVSSLKRQVVRMRQQLQKAQADLNLANIRAAQAARKDTELKRRPEAEVRPEEKEDSAAEKTRTEEERVAAQRRVDALNDTQNGLAAQLANAEAQLEVAQAAFERASSVTIRAAQAESAAFANMRDNAAFWFAPAVATSTDPAKRVEITSSGGENAIFIRGAREDIAKVQDIVAKLDEPAPQARMTLWKIELNSDATQKGAERFNKALEVVEEELASTRAKIADTLSLLLNSVSEEADYAASTSPPPPLEKQDCHERREYAKYFPNPGNTDITGRYQRLKRYSLYAHQVRRELGIEFLDQLGFDNPKGFGIKDPSSATTLNEALIITLLTDSFHRTRIMQRFQDGMKKFEEPGSSEKTEFTRLASMLRDGPQHSGTDFEITRQQQELIYAMRNPLLKHLVGRIARLQVRVQHFKELYAKENGISLPVNGTSSAGNGTSSALNGTSSPPTPQDVALDADLYSCLKQKLPKIFDTIHDEFLISPFDILNANVSLVDSGEGTIALQLPNALKAYNLRPSPARVAAADGMLDVYTKAFEDDIDRVFVRPMLRRLREKLRKTGIGFGVIQRTSVLATNRLVARVDPRATSELSVGQETNLIQGLQQIAQLTLDARKGNLPGVFGQLGQLAAENDAAEIYGITSGSAFQVTPIFDPTGQALRFKFDFVDTTLVREPRGTVNPRLPRVERHTVNTEVQLANLEIREVSRFESDAKIGLPTTYRGGLPILRDLPGVRPIPLIGWFIRRKGSNAIAQRSLIFAQTTMSPTIGDILDLFDTSLQRR